MVSSSGVEKRNEAGCLETDEGAGRKTQRDICLEVVLGHPGCTAAELGQSCGLDQLAISRRLPELLKLGRLQKGQSRRCDVTRRLSITWFPKEEKRAEVMP